MEPLDLHEQTGLLPQWSNAFEALCLALGEYDADPVDGPFGGTVVSF